MKKIISVLLSLLLVFGTMGICVYAEENPYYVVIGDSITYGSGLRNPVKACYGRIVADTNGYDYVNHAIPGYTTTNLISHLMKNEVAEDIKKADIISISIGGNDFLMNNMNRLMFQAIVKEDYSRFDEIADGFFENFSQIIDIINGYNEDAVILAQTLYNPQTGELRAAYQQGVDRLNAAIVRYAEENPGEIVIIDVGTRLGDDGANFAADGIHPSAKGNEEIAVAILEKLYEMGLGSSTQPVINEKGEDIKAAAIINYYTVLTGKIFKVIAVFYKAITKVFPW